VFGGTFAVGYTYLPNSSLVGTVTIAGTNHLARSRMLDLLLKDFVPHRLRISIQYAPSSLLAFEMNLRRNHFPPK
jgi:pyoverdine/dityrosine biosynthesis protein Dit1